MGFIIALVVFIIFGFAVNGLVTLVIGTAIKLGGGQVDRAALSKKCLNWTMFILLGILGLALYYLIATSDVAGDMCFGEATFLLIKILLGAVLVLGAIAFVIFLFYRWGKWIDE